MNRISKLLILVLALFSTLLVGCKEKKFSLSDKYYDSENYGIIESSLEEVVEAENNKESFITFIYLNGCSTCDKLKGILDTFLVEAKIKVYAVAYDKLEKGTTLKATVRYAPSVVIFKKGKVVDFLDTASDKDIDRFNSFDAFKEWIESYIEVK